jgi:hypothetical protein
MWQMHCGYSTYPEVG